MRHKGLLFCVLSFALSVDLAQAEEFHGIEGSPPSLPADFLPEDSLADESLAGAVREGGSLRSLGEVLHGPGCLDVEYIYTGEVFTNMRGGLNTTNATEYRGNFDLTITADLEEMGLAPGGKFFIWGQNGHGRGLTQDHVGDFQVLSNIDDIDFVQVSEYWWERAFGDGMVLLRIGKQDCNNTFAVVESAGSFINSSFGYHPTIPMPTFPDPSMAVVGWFQLTECLAFEIGVWDGAPDGRNWGFSGSGETFSICEVEYSYALGPDEALPGDFHIGPWYHSDLFDDPAPGSSAAHEGNYGYHLEWEQLLYDENSYDADDSQGLIAFIQYAWAPADRNLAEDYFGAGLTYTGLFEGRDEDILGLGVARVSFSDRFPDESYETAIELFYRAAVSGGVLIQPDLQYIANPIANGRDAFAFGLRFEAAL